MKITVEFSTLEEFQEFLNFKDSKNKYKLSDLSQRTQDVLRKNGVNSIVDIFGKTDTELLKFVNLGKKGLDEIRSLMADVDSQAK